MRRRFHKPNRRQLHLLLVSIDQWVDSGHRPRCAWQGFAPRGGNGFHPPAILRMSPADLAG